MRVALLGSPFSREGVDWGAVARRKRVLLWLLGIGALAAAALVALFTRAPRPVPFEEVPVPEAWFAPPVEPVPPQEAVPEESPPGSPLPNEPPLRRPREAVPPGYVQVGKLAYELDGRRVAEEGYRLERLPSGELLLVSEGTFTIRFLLVSVRMSFQQEVRLDEGLRLRLYRLDARGPLGVGSRRISIVVEGGRAVADAGDGPKEVPIPEGRAFFVGTVASYALLPVLYGAWAHGDGLLLQPVGVGAGPPGTSASGPIEVVSAGTAEVGLGGRLVLLDRYEVRAGAFAGTLLARDLEFVAFVGRGERSFSAYRSDLFPRGFSTPSGGL